MVVSVSERERRRKPERARVGSPQGQSQRETLPTCFLSSESWNCNLHNCPRLGMTLSATLRSIVKSHPPSAQKTLCPIPVCGDFSWLPPVLRQLYYAATKNTRAYYLHDWLTWSETFILLQSTWLFMEYQDHIHRHNHRRTYIIIDKRK